MGVSSSALRVHCAVLHLAIAVIAGPDSTEYDPTAVFDCGISACSCSGNPQPDTGRSKGNIHYRG